MKWYVKVLNNPEVESWLRDYAANYMDHAYEVSNYTDRARLLCQTPVWAKAVKEAAVSGVFRSSKEMYEYCEAVAEKIEAFAVEDCPSPAERHLRGMIAKCMDRIATLEYETRDLYSRLSEVQDRLSHVENGTSR